MKSLISPGQDGYHSPLRNEPTHHTVEPHHLQHYNGSWLFIAYSHERNSWRKFALPHQRPPAPGRNLPPAPPQRLAGPARRRLFGLIQGPTLVTVTLRFTPCRAGWIREQIWHEDQKMVDHPDSHLDLSFLAADLREVKLRVLQFGAEVEVSSRWNCWKRYARKLRGWWSFTGENENMRNRKSEHKTGGQ